MKQTTALLAIVLTGIAAAAPAASSRVNPAPSGDPLEIASDALAQAKSSCGKVIKATRFKDGVVEAICSSGDRYLVFTLNGITMTKRCTFATTLGIHDC
jgi:hypothetical protein